MTLITKVTVELSGCDPPSVAVITRVCLILSSLSNTATVDTFPLVGSIVNKSLEPSLVEVIEYIIREFTPASMSVAVTVMTKLPAGRFSEIEA